MQRQDYPRPEFVRPRIMLLDGEWERTNKPISAEEAANAEFEYRFRAPFSPGSVPREEMAAAVWLRRRFVLQPFDASGTVILNFNGISGAYSVFLNGSLLFSSEGAHSNHIDVSSLALAGENVLTVCSSAKDFSKGLTGSVWLEFAAKSFYSFLRPAAVYSDRSIYLRGMISGETEGLKTVVEVAFDGKLLLSETYRAAPDFTLHVPLKRLPDMWSEGRGKIYDVRVTLKSSDGAVLDRVYTYTAFKESVLMDGGVYVNGRKVFFKALSDPLYYPASIDAPRSKTFAEGVAKAQAAGFNTVFFTEYPSPAELYVLDKFGMYAIIAMPDFDVAEQSYYGLIMRDFGHPCIAVWKPEFKEYDAKTVERVYNGIKGKDPFHCVMTGDSKELYLTDLYTFSAAAEDIPLYLLMRFNGGILSEKEEWKFNKTHPGLSGADRLRKLPAVLFCEPFDIPDEGDRSGERRFRESFAELERNSEGLSGYVLAPMYDSPSGKGILNFSRGFKALLFDAKAEKPAVR